MANGNVAHELAEVLRLGGKVAAVVDSEKSSESDQPMKARRDFKGVCQSLGIECCVTQRRALENYLSQEALDAAFGARFQELSQYEEPGSNFWGKGESWRAAARMTKENLDKTDIGQFLASL